MTGPGAERLGDHEAAEIKAAWFENGAGERVATLGQGEPLRLCAEFKFHTEVEDPIFALHLRNDARHTIFATSTNLHDANTGKYPAGETVTLRVLLDNWLAGGRYVLTPTIARRGAGTDVLDLREDIAQLVVHGTHQSGGIVEIPHDLVLDRA